MLIRRQTPLSLHNCRTVYGLRREGERYSIHAADAHPYTTPRDHWHNQVPPSTQWTSHGETLRTNRSWTPRLVAARSGRPVSKKSHPRFDYLSSHSGRLAIFDSVSRAELAVAVRTRASWCFHIALHYNVASSPRTPSPPWFIDP